MLGEFDLIRRYFWRSPNPGQTVIGVGDDCALLIPTSSEQLAVTTDTLVSGVHFFPEVDPFTLGHKTLAVNLSDLAAMGARPRWVTLALTLPAVDEGWLEPFADGFLTLAQAHDVELVGGDTTRGPLSLTVQALGEIPPGKALLRSGAKPGDDVYVTGTIGDGGLALKMLRGEWPRSDAVLARLFMPTPRVTAGLRLRDEVHAAIDISDGFAADLTHILTSSAVGATVHIDAMPVSEAMQGYVAATGDWSLPVAAGDDYELCFTAPGRFRGKVKQLAGDLDLAITRVGTIESKQGLRLVREGMPVALERLGFVHF